MEGVDQGVNLTSYLDSSHMVSQYLLIHSKAVEARIKLSMTPEVMGLNARVNKGLFDNITDYLTLSHKDALGFLLLLCAFNSVFSCYTLFLLSKELFWAII